MRLPSENIWRSLSQAVRLLLLFAIALGISVATAASALPISASRLTLATLAQGAAIAQTDPDFPLQPHSLPPTLAQWQDSNQAGDYFDQVQAEPVGYLIWTHFPITVYIQPPTDKELAVPFSAKRSRVWMTAVSQAVQEWNRYLPLTVANQADDADIVVLRSPPPLQVETILAPNQERAPGQTQPEPRPTLQIRRARSAETSYKVYVKGSSKDTASSKPLLAHRCTIQLRPDQAPQYLQAAARHELGHALGIWGHSRSQTDVMYFSQVRNPSPISPRDLNTLKRVYEQPTRLGWALVE